MKHSERADQPELLEDLSCPSTSDRILYLTNFFNLPIIFRQRLIGVTNMFGNNYESDFLAVTGDRIPLFRNIVPRQYFKFSGFKESSNPMVILELDNDEVEQRKDLRHISGIIATIDGSIHVKHLKAIHVPDEETLDMVQSQFHYVSGFAQYEGENFQNLCAVSRSLFEPNEYTEEAERRVIEEIFTTTDSIRVQELEDIYRKFNLLGGALHVVFQTIWRDTERVREVTNLLNSCFYAFGSAPDNFMCEIQTQLQSRIAGLLENPSVRNPIYKENNELLGIILSEIINEEDGNSWAPRALLERISAKIQSSDSLSQPSKRKLLSRLQTGTYSIKNILLSSVEFNGFSESSETDIVMDALLIFCLGGNNLEHLANPKWTENYNIAVIPSLLAAFFTGLRIGRTRIEPLDNKDNKLDELLSNYLWQTALNKGTNYAIDPQLTDTAFKLVDEKSQLESSYLITWQERSIHRFTITNPIWEIFEASEGEDPDLRLLGLEICRKMEWEECIQTKITLGRTPTQIQINQDDFVLEFSGTDMQISQTLRPNDFIKHLKMYKLDDEVSNLIYEHLNS